MGKSLGGFSSPKKKREKEEIMFSFVTESQKYNKIVAYREGNFKMEFKSMIKLKNRMALEIKKRMDLKMDLMYNTRLFVLKFFRSFGTRIIIIIQRRKTTTYKNERNHIMYGNHIVLCMAIILCMAFQWFVGLYSMISL